MRWDSFYFSTLRSPSPLPLRAQPRALAAGFAPYPNGSRHAAPLAPARAPPPGSSTGFRRVARRARPRREGTLGNPNPPDADADATRAPKPPAKPHQEACALAGDGVDAPRRQGSPVPVAVPAPDRRRRRAVQRQVLRSRGDSRPRLSAEGRGDMHATPAHPAAAMRRRRGEGHREVPAQTRRGARRADTRSGPSARPARSSPQPPENVTPKLTHAPPSSTRFSTTFARFALRSKPRPTASSAQTPNPSAPSPSSSPFEARTSRISPWWTSPDSRRFQPPINPRPSSATSKPW